MRQPLPARRSSLRRLPVLFHDLLEARRVVAGVAVPGLRRFRQLSFGARPGVRGMRQPLRARRLSRRRLPVLFHDLLEACRVAAGVAVPGLRRFRQLSFGARPGVRGMRRPLRARRLSLRRLPALFDDLLEACREVAGVGVPVLRRFRRLSFGARPGERGMRRPLRARRSSLRRLPALFDDLLEACRVVAGVAVLVLRRFRQLSFEARPGERGMRRPLRARRLSLRRLPVLSPDLLEACRVVAGAAVPVLRRFRRLSFPAWLAVRGIRRPRPARRVPLQRLLAPARCRLPSSPEVWPVLRPSPRRWRREVVRVPPGARDTGTRLPAVLEQRWRLDRHRAPAEAGRRGTALPGTRFP